MQVNTSVQEACNDADLEQAVLSAKAKVAKVSESAVTVLCIAGGNSNGRRLAESVITWKYMITVGSQDQANDIVSLIDAKNETAMTDEITGFLSENSQYKTVTVTDVTAATIIVVTVTTTTTTGGPDSPRTDDSPNTEWEDDSHAHTPAALVAVAMAMVTATLTLSH